MERNIKLLGVFNFFGFFQFFSAILVIYFAKVTGSYVLAMSLFSVTMFSSALFEVPTGIFSDKIGRKKTIMLGSTCLILSTLFYALGQSYWILFIGALFEGLSRSWFSGNNDAFLHDTLSEIEKNDLYAHYLGKIKSMEQLALLIGAVSGSIMAQWSFSLVIWLSIIPQATGLFISLFFVEPPHLIKGKTNIFSHIKLSALHLWKNKTLRLLSLQDILSYGIGEAAFSFSAAFIGTVWPIWAIGFSKMLSFGGAAVGFWFSGRIIRKIGAYKILLFTQFSNRIVSLVAYIKPTVFSPILTGSLSLLYGLSSVSHTSLMQKEFTHEQRATLGSLNSFLGSIFFGLFAPILGIFADRFGPAHALVMVQICSFSTLFITWKLFKTHPQHI